MLVDILTKQMIATDFYFLHLKGAEQLLTQHFLDLPGVYCGQA